MEVMEMGLTEQIPMRRQTNWNLHQQFQHVRKPRFPRPEGSHESQLQNPRQPNLGKKARNETKGRERVSLKVIPAL